MSRKCKFDLQWEQALSLLEESEATQAREVIESYQTTGVMPEGMPAKFEMILLLVKPLIDRRRHAAEMARKRRCSAKLVKEQPRQVEADEVVEVENNLVADTASVVVPLRRTNPKKQRWFRRAGKKKRLPFTLRKR